MSEANGARGLIAVDKMVGKVLFLNPATYATEVVLDGFPRTVHELLVIPETARKSSSLAGQSPGHDRSRPCGKRLYRRRRRQKSSGLN